MEIIVNQRISPEVANQLNGTRFSLIAFLIKTVIERCGNSPQPLLGEQLDVAPFRKEQVDFICEGLQTDLSI